MANPSSSQQTSQAPEGSTNLNFGRPMVAIPGPSIIPERVLSAMSRPMPDIYSGELVEISDEVFARLPSLARTTGKPFVVMSNGHGAWQMAIANTLARDDKVLVLESGRFAVVWGEMAAISGVKVEVLPGSDDRPVDPAALQARLADDPGHEIKAILTVQTDTATSVRNDIAALRNAIDEAGHPALFMVDCIASLGCEPFEMDVWGVDVTVAGSQKGLMVPPGLAFVWASEKAIEAYDRSDIHVGYLDWRKRLNATVHYELYSGTPPVSHLYGLREALAMIEEEGLEARWDRHAVLASAVWAAVDAWSGGGDGSAAGGGIALNIADPAFRSTAVTTIRTGDIDAAEVRRICADGAGLTLGLGIGDFAGRAFRIGHMGYLNPPMLLGTLGTVEAALLSMGTPIGGSGVAAAAAALSAHMD
ncbi:MAG: pyridoxal-phosphate-dependent aminotransferase family protein [Acidimicrobiales bacterium]